jgi:hypothetical protein
MYAAIFSVLLPRRFNAIFSVKGAIFSAGIAIFSVFLGAVVGGFSY